MSKMNIEDKLCKNLEDSCIKAYKSGQQSMQAEIDSLKVQLSLQRDRNKALEAELTSSRNYGDGLHEQLNNLEACYIQVKKERDDAVYLKNEHRKRRCQLAKELTQKSLRLTEAEFEYKRIKELQAKDCLQIMRLTARNEKLSDELKALRGEHENSN